MITNDKVSIDIIMNLLEVFILISSIGLVTRSLLRLSTRFQCVLYQEHTLSRRLQPGPLHGSTSACHYNICRCNICRCNVCHCSVCHYSVYSIIFLSFFLCLQRKYVFSMACKRFFKQVLLIFRYYYVEIQHQIQIIQCVAKPFQ